jgi:cyclic beta-1,2-glucan synthetase
VPEHDVDLQRLRAAGRQFAKGWRVRRPDRAMGRQLGRKAKQIRGSLDALLHPPPVHGPDARWLVDNYRLILTAHKETRQFLASFTDYRGTLADPEPVPYALANAYISAAIDFFSEEGLAAFVEGFQDLELIEMSEIWALKPALQTVLLQRILDAMLCASPVATLITSLRHVGECAWKELFERVSVVHAILARDPAGCYSRMDYVSRDQYRNVITDVARRSDRAESEVAEDAVGLAAGAGSERQRHIGYWLVDKGLATLRAQSGYRPSLHQRVREQVLAWPQAYYLIGIEVLTLVLAFTIVDFSGDVRPTVVALFLLILPVTQAAIDFMNNLTTWLLPPRALPKLDFSEGIPDECATMVTVPTLLLNDKQVRRLVGDLEIRFLANRDRNLCFALLTDCPDSDKPEDDRDRLVDVCVGLIDDLNARYGSPSRTPFYMFHRRRVYNPSEGRWMGWERKRGKLIDLNRFMRGGTDSFPVKVGNPDVLPKIKYVITLDSDTQLPRDSAHKLVGAIAHPLHKAVIDPATRMVVEGYGILQPRIGVSIDSAASSRLANIFSGQTGFDIYTRAVSDVYQDLFGEGIFTGKGIYDVDAMTAAIEDRFPENALLSHDLIEGAYARVALVSDIELIDDYPSHFSAYSRRRHRWVRGDWQIMRWLLPQVPDVDRNIVPNPISLISRWKILDNLRRSLFEPATLALFVGGWLILRGDPLYWTLASLSMLLLPVYASLLFACLRAPVRSVLLGAWAKDTASAFLKGHVQAFLHIVFLLHQAMLSLDAIGRSMARLFVTRKRLLEWETAAEAENMQRRTAAVDKYLAWSPAIALALAAIVWMVRPESMPVAAPILTLWFSARFLSAWLNRAPRSVVTRITAEDGEFLRETAEKTWAYFRDFAEGGLIPDNVREDGTEAKRLSPTNLGLLLNARVAAVHFGFLTLAEFVSSTIETLEAVRKLPKYRGHLLNWYCTDTHRVLEPRFVSTVDSGNLAASLWTVKQAAVAFAETAAGAEAERLRAIASECDALVEEMDFAFLYLRTKKVLSIGCDVDSGLLEPAAYDLLASEARIAAFIAIAKGDIPQESWFHLGRRHALAYGQRVLVSWTGTLFEYLMPLLWMKHPRNTILQNTAEAIVRVQQRFARRHGMPWGISESACASGVNGEYGYHAFGIPAVAMKTPESEPLVVSPYSTFLALAVDPRAAMKNLRRMAGQGAVGRYGFYEAIDYSGERPELIRSWMAHHQGMSLLAICNLLHGDKLREYFHAEPQVLATELLLHERVPSATVIEKQVPAPPAMVAQAAV